MNSNRLNGTSCCADRLGRAFKLVKDDVRGNIEVRRSSISRKILIEYCSCIMDRPLLSAQRLKGVYNTHVHDFEHLHSILVYERQSGRLADDQSCTAGLVWLVRCVRNVQLSVLVLQLKHLFDLCKKSEDPSYIKEDTIGLVSKLCFVNHSVEYQESQLHAVR